jgi:hypothetical protein
MLYKALGWTAWKAIRFFLRRRLAHVATKRNAAIAGGTVAAGGAAAVGARQLRSSS